MKGIGMVSVDEGTGPGRPSGSSSCPWQPIGRDRRRNAAWSVVILLIATTAGCGGSSSSGSTTIKPLAPPGRVKVRDGSDAPELREFTEVMPIPEGRVELDLIPSEFKRKDPLAYFDRIQGTDGQVSVWRGSAVTQIAVPDTDGAITVRMDNPIEFVDDNDALFWTCGRAGRNGSYGVITVPVGTFGADRKRVLNDRYYQAVHPRAVVDQPGTGRFVLANIESVEASTVMAVETATPGSAPFESRCSVFADPNDPAVYQGLSSDDMHS